MIKHRYRTILLFFGRVFAGLILWDLLLPRIGLGAWSRRSRHGRYRKIATAYRRLAVQLGGVHIKVGQFLSSRVDILPESITDELAGLQDEVPAEDFADIERVFLEEYGEPAGHRFAWIDPEPMAAASLGQVHRAGLAGAFPDSTEAIDEIVVKVQRPNIAAVIETDLAALRTVGNWLDHYPPVKRRADVPALLADFSRVLYEEIDYLAEGRNAEKFAANFAAQPRLRVPRVAWTHTTRRVLCLENVLDIKISDYAAIVAAGLDRSEVAQQLFGTYLLQILEHGFFHADPHPGNLFVSPAGDNGHPGTWQLTFVDFGMVGHVTAGMHEGIREMIIAMGTQDSGRLIQAYQKLGVLLPSADLALLEEADRRVFEQFWGKSMAELRAIPFEEMRAIGMEFKDLIYAMPFQIPQDLIWLGRTMAILSGLCTGLDPNFNFWTSLLPHAQRLLAEEVSQDWEVWAGELGKIGRNLLEAPLRINRLLERLEKDRLSVHVPEVEQQTRRVEPMLKRLSSVLLFSALLLAGVQLFLAGYQAAGTSMGVTGSLILLWSLVRHRPGSR